MKIVDTNVLLYAVNAGSAPHSACRAWLIDALEGAEGVGLPWVSLLGFIRISTNPRIFEHPLTSAQATDLVQAWLAQPSALTPEPTPRHASILAGLVAPSGVAGNLTTDAHLAALALEYDAEVVTMDRDFERFGVRVVVPGRL
ncbi:type II toxin-antitoxin system VapC family toxin [Yimella sp. cx-51]|uniref:type II toxin-antitoxin system VapC family toxin n=1 Tax=Yimella sp. cx-51 TaxID=2770551 RepID=UPI00165E2BB1|nr:type II toxin-antitoxin system VapC family toxin [Yimella sp. cx-51]MBC9957920.1 type II toxin-antitoxin system VapC family toxin [Yimella sp. cx-51]QTH38054.1 type II toxin-antitoxin system VapC family toxin [Yimella sp. cx-51]